VVFENVTLREWIELAYGIADRHYALIGPAWLDTERFDVNAKVAPAVPRQQMLAMLRALLADRFKLQAHQETRELNVYRLVVARGGPKLQRTTATGANFTFGAGHIVARALSMDEFADRLSGPVFKLGRPVLNATGLAGEFDFTLDWRLDGVNTDDAGMASLFTAVQEQLGLRLEAAKSAVLIRVVDHMERRPVEN
jgi:uncharacterized protein (TIGR03435 family)